MTYQLPAQPRIDAPGISYEGASSKGITVLLCGHPGSWKTTWSAQWPGVVFISVAAEGGDESLAEYPRIAQLLMEKSKMVECPPVFNTAIPPVFKAFSCKDFLQYIQQICLNHRRWGILTVVVDSLTYLTDLWLNELFDLKEKSDPKWVQDVRKRGGELIGPQEWGFLNSFLRSVRVDLSNQGLNVIWTCLQNDTYKSDAKNIMERELVNAEPMITGKNKVTLPGACKLHIWAEKSWVMDPRPEAMGRQVVQPTYWVSSNNVAKWPRHRYGLAFKHGKLMDPEFGNYPTFRAIWAELSQHVYLG